VVATVNTALEVDWVRIGDHTFIAALYHPPRPIYKQEVLPEYVEASVAEITHGFAPADIVIAGDINQLPYQDVVELMQIVHELTCGANVLDKICVWSLSLQYCLHHGFDRQERPRCRRRVPRQLMLEECDDQLFCKIINNPHRMPHQLLSPQSTSSQQYHLRHRTHDRQLPAHHGHLAGWVTGQLADKPTRGQKVTDWSSRRLVNSPKYLIENLECIMAPSVISDRLLYLYSVNIQ